MKTNILYYGDNLEVMHRYIEDDSIDLIYIDPPFFSSKAYEIVYGDSKEVRMFEDRWKGDIRHYVDWMVPRLALMREKLKPTGSIYLHLDWHAVHYLKIVMDRIFGIDNFLNEIIWSYGAKATQRTSSFQRKHDTILLYAKSEGRHIFNAPLQEYSEASLRERKTRYDHTDADGTYRLTTRRDKQGDKYRAKVYLHKGVIMTDVWQLPIINATAKERLGYPTQKPEVLLRRIIEASSNRDDIIADFFCGCGELNHLKCNRRGIC